MINKDNVEELWTIYEDYKETFYKTHYSDVKCYNFEEFVDSEVTKCSNCDRYVLNDHIGFSELAIQDNICEDCMENGYGK